MARKLLFLNIILILGVALLGLQLLSGWQAFQDENGTEQLFAQAGADEPALPDYEPRGLDDPGYVDYSVVVERNLFAEDRRPPLPGEEDVAEETAPDILPREPLLHGVARIGDYTVAQITKFEPRNPQGSRVQVSIGDQISGWTIARIESDAMTLQWKDEERVIPKTEAPRPQQVANRGAAGGGVRIITIGSRAAAVESTTSSATEEQQQSGLQVASVGSQQGATPGQQQTRGAQQQGSDLTGRQNLRGGVGSSTSRNSRLQRNRPIQQGRPPR
ncbi:MAG TPA: hypothetical protein VLU25_07105 [Acidobacteriota bacterium]|nr:hypothetical protein [Acidobacteriota bacterium]